MSKIKQKEFITPDLAKDDFIKEQHILIQKLKVIEKDLINTAKLLREDLIIADMNVDKLQKELKELKANSPKYKIGQKVYALKDNKIIIIAINSILIKESTSMYSKSFCCYNENQLFPTIQDLLDDLASQEIKEL